MTTSVKQLRDALAKYPDDMPVVPTWEGIFTEFRLDRLEVAHTKIKYNDEKPQDILVIDVNQD